MSVAKNYLYNVLYQILTLIIPLVTVPYISDVLGTVGVGINAYSFSIVQYFVLFGMMGVSLYGNRTIATVRDDIKNLNKKFWEIYIIQLVICGISTVLYLLFVTVFIKDSRDVFFVQSLYIISAAIDISWLFMGLEEFKKTVARNTIIKILGVICIFIFVKKPDDLVLYVGILAISNLLGQLVLWGHVKKLIGFKFIKSIKINDMIKNIKPMMVLFIPQIASQVYTVLNKTMLGIISTKSEVGIFENSDKIIKIILAVVTSLGAVMLPRIANEFAKGRFDKVNNYIYKSLNFVSIIAVPMTFGIAAISKEFVGWFLPEDFQKCSVIIPIISPIILLIAWSNVLGIQYMIPAGRNKEFTTSLTAGAVINLILNFIFIKYFQSIGAGISTVISEAVVTIIQIYLLRKDINMFTIIPELIKYVIAAVFMVIIVRIIGNSYEASVITTVVQIILGGLVYLISLILLKSIYIKEAYTVIIEKIKK